MPYGKEGCPKLNTTGRTLKKQTIGLCRISAILQGYRLLKSKNKVKTGENTFARATVFNEGKDEHPNRKRGKGSGINGKFTTEATQMPITSPFEKSNRKAKQCRISLHSSHWGRITSVL